MVNTLSRLHTPETWFTCTLGSAVSWFLLCTEVGNPQLRHMADNPLRLSWSRKCKTSNVIKQKVQWLFSRSKNLPYPTRPRWDHKEMSINPVWRIPHLWVRRQFLFIGCCSQERWKQLHLAVGWMCQCIPGLALLVTLPATHTGNEHRTLATRQHINIFARAEKWRVFHLRFGFPLPFCQLACLTAMLLSSFAKEHEIGHTVSPLETSPSRGKADSGSGRSYYLPSSS